MSEMDYRQMAADVVKLARGRGADEAECTISEGDEFSVTVRMREIETLKEAGARGAGVRVLLGQRPGSSYTSDLTPDGLARMIADAAGDVDLLVRTGGEQRLSDFLLWECAYAELYFTARMWPDFTAHDLAAAVSAFGRRERRFGTLPDAHAGGAR